MTTFGGRSAGGAAPPSDDRAEHGRVDPAPARSAPATTSVRPSAAAAHGVGVEAPVARCSGVPGDQRPGDDRRARRRARAAGRPASGRRRSTPSRALVACADAATASWVSTTPFGVARSMPLVATTRASPASTGRPPSSASCRRRRRPAGAIAPAARPGRAGRRWSSGKHGVAVVPRPPQRVDERRRRRQSSATRRAMGGSVRTAPARLGRHDRAGPASSHPAGGRGSPVLGRARCRPRSCPVARRHRVRVGRRRRSRGGASRRRWSSSLALQVGVNYANDYSDGVRGTDDVARRAGAPRRLAGSRRRAR